MLEYLPKKEREVFMMDREVDLRVLLADNLVSSYTVKNCSQFNKETGDFAKQVIIRNFNDIPNWSTIKQSGFIESIITGCELPLIVVFEISKDPVQYLLIDGLNRFVTIQKFLADELRLNPQGIEKSAFLEGKIFSDIEKEEGRDYFNGRGIQILKISYKNNGRKLSSLQIEAIAKQLYIRFNSGSKLKNEEIQKADYQDDWITKQIEQKLTNQDPLLDKLNKVYFTPKKQTKTYIESALMYCRLAITSCYAPLEPFCRQKSILKKIDNFYKEYTLEVKKENIMKDFEIVLDVLAEITNRDYWNEYPILHHQTFMMITYWLIFLMKKHQLSCYDNFDWKKYITYFGDKENSELFITQYRVPLFKKYQAVMDYILENYKIDLSKYLIQELQTPKKTKIYSFHELPKYNFQLSRDPITVSTLLELLESESFILRPGYQRRELHDLKFSSFLLESLMLNINIPDILV